MVTSYDYDVITGTKPIEVYGVHDPNISEAFFYVTRNGVRDGLAFNFARLFSQPGTFWVDPVNGNDGNGGESSESAFKTLQHAIDQCVDNRGDVIIRMPGAEVVTSAVLLNKAGVSIIASNWGGNRREASEEFYTFSHASFTDGPALYVTKPSKIIGCSFIGRNATGPSILVEYSQPGGPNGLYAHLLECRVQNWGTSAHGIELKGATYARIENCEIDGAGNSFTSGVRFTGSSLNNPSYNAIVGCTFRDCVAGILHTQNGSSQNCLYKGNAFSGCTAAIDFGGFTGSGLIADNWHEKANTAAYDDTVANEKALGFAFSGNHYAE